MSDFQIVSDFRPTGDQPEAIEQLVAGLEKGGKAQTLLGVTGSGKTFTTANVIERWQKPSLVLARDRALRVQVCWKFKEVFPVNAVEYFVSYFADYQPEAYIPLTESYIAKG